VFGMMVSVYGWLAPVVFGPVVRQSIMGGVHGGAQLLISWLGSKERKEGGGRTTIPFRGMPPNDLTSFHEAVPLKAPTTFP
jgi:hypothetical protein